jgi:hypothetical protein
MIRYEDLRTDAEAVLSELAGRLELDVSPSLIAGIVDGYRPANVGDKTGSHFRGGGRRMDSMTPRQQRMARWLFAKQLATMGYNE